MAKPLGPKSAMIREAITANPDLGNTELAKLLNDADERMDDKFKVTAQDVATQRQSMKKAAPMPTAAAATPAPTAKPARKKPGRKPARRATAPTTAQAASAPTANVNLDVLDELEAVKKLVARFGAEKVRRMVALFE